jgi:histidinol-phosphate/aromatic aminotransferase/cobyric acid decarboxylase-like protein
LTGKEYCGSEDEHLRKIPLLKDVFETFPNIQVNIDVKEGSDELIEQIGNLIKEYKREKLTVWGSFKEDASLKCYNQV